MSEKEYYDRFLKDRYPNMPRDFNESEGYYYHDMAQFGFRSFKYRAGLRPTTPGKISKEKLASYKEDDPSTIVDRLNGFYGGNEEPYPVLKREAEAAREIVRLREENEGFKDAVAQAHYLLGELLAEATGETEEEIYRVFDLLRYRLGIYAEQIYTQSPAVS